MSYVKPFESVELFENTFRHQINKKTQVVEERKFVFDKSFGDGEDQWPIVADRYRLIWMPGCPHSNKAVLLLRILGLDRVISVGEAGILRDPRGWVFSEDLDEVDPVLKVHYLDDVYLASDPNFTGRSTVPLIADATTGKAVNNDAWILHTYLVRDWMPFFKENAPELYPEDLRDEIDALNEFLRKVNAYGCGFARTQKAYDEAFEQYFEVLDQLEERLADQRFLFGDYITLSDIHLYVALVRYQVNYHLVFGVNKKRLEDYPNLWNYTRDLYQTSEFRDYTKLDLIKMHYQLSPHMRAKLGNVYGIKAIGPDASKWEVPTGREQLSSDPEHKYQYRKETRPQFAHKDEEGEIAYLKEYVLRPIEEAGKATFQTDYERWAYQVEDAFKIIDRRLEKQKYLLGDSPSKADLLFYQTLLRFDHIYYYIYKLNFAKTFDYPNIRRYEQDLGTIPAYADSIDIVKEREEAFLNLSDARNPYHLVFRGPEL
jgi:glutathionyl-hydroquinone reductase